MLPCNRTLISALFFCTLLTIQFGLLSLLPSYWFDSFITEAVNHLFTAPPLHSYRLAVHMSSLCTGICIIRTCPCFLGHQTYMYMFKHCILCIGEMEAKVTLHYNRQNS